MKVQIMISESAAFTPAQEKKLVLGAKLVEHKLSRRIGGGGVSFSKSKIQHTITDVVLTKSGAIKSVTTEGAYLGERGGKIVTLSTQEYKFTPTQLVKLLDAPLPKTSDNKPTRAIRFGDATGAKASDNVVQKAIRELDKQIAELQSKRNNMQAKLDKQASIVAKEANKAKEMKLSEKGIYFSVEVSKPIRAGEEKVSKPTLSAARTVRPSMSSSGFIYAVVGKKKQKVMTYTSTDPITKKTIKGKIWFFVSKEMKKKFG